MDIDVIQAKVRANEFLFSDHALEEAEEELIELNDVKEAVLNGEILEQYLDTGRGESCLILGSVKDRPIHVVCG